MTPGRQRRSRPDFLRRRRTLPSALTSLCRRHWRPGGRESAGLKVSRLLDNEEVDWVQNKTKEWAKRPPDVRVIGCWYWLQTEWLTLHCVFYFDLLNLHQTGAHVCTYQTSLSCLAFCCARVLFVLRRLCCHLSVKWRHGQDLYCAAPQLGEDRVAIQQLGFHERFLTSRGKQHWLNEKKPYFKLFTDHNISE